MRFCKLCDTNKDSSLFYKATGYQCKQCVTAKSKARADRLGDAHRQRVRELYRLNPTPAKQRAAAFRQANPGYDLAAKKKWKQENRDIKLADTRRRYLSQKNAVPKWANHFFIREIYNLSKLRGLATGIKWHVDHMVPLNSPLVCGLHVEHNLNVIPAVLNMKKSNKTWPDMPEAAV